MLILQIIAILLLLVLTVMTAASEIAIIAVSKFRLRRLAAGGSIAAKAILKILEAPERFFSTILVANNIVNTLIASLVTMMMIAVFKEGEGVLVATIVVSLVIIVCEVVAKTLAANNAERLALFLARPVEVLIALVAPLVRGFVFITNAVVKLVGGQAKGKPGLMTEDEIRSMIKLSGEQGIIHTEQYKMLTRVFDFRETLVAKVMTPKKEMVALDAAAPIEAILEKALESGYSRLPVYRDRPENIVGIINMKDLLSLAVNRDLIVFQDIINPVVTVPGTKKVTELLKEFQKGHTHLALVVDAQGRIEGIITLEDLLEEIVGEIEDEYDVRAKPAKKLQPPSK